MKRKLKLYMCLILIFTLLSSLPIVAAPPSLTDTQIKEIKVYVDTIELTQKNINTLAQSILFSSSYPLETLQSSLQSLRINLDNTLIQINDYLKDAGVDTPYYRNLLILANAINYMKASIYELNSLSTQTAPSEMLATLERFFNFRVYATNSLHFFDTLQSY